MRTASCTSLSVNVGIPSGRILSEFFFCIYVRLTGVGLNLPFFSCSVIFCIFLSLKPSAVSSFTPFVDAPLFAYRFLYASNHISSRNKYLNRRVNTSSLLFNEYCSMSFCLFSSKFRLLVAFQPLRFSSLTFFIFDHNNCFPSPCRRCYRPRTTMETPYHWVIFRFLNHSFSALTFRVSSVSVNNWLQIVGYAFVSFAQVLLHVI